MKVKNSSKKITVLEIKNVGELIGILKNMHPDLGLVGAGGEPLILELPREKYAKLTFK